MLMRNRISTVILVFAGIASVVWQQGAVALFLGAGLAISGLVQPPSIASQWSKLALQTGVVILGLSLPFSEIIRLTSDNGLIVCSMVLLTLIGGVCLQKLFAADLTTGRLLTTGTAVCGGTAVATMAPVLQASATQVAQALTIIFVLNGIAIIGFPLIGESLGMSQEAFGMWAAIAIHDTSSVVGAASIYGDEALATATTLKILRILWLIPLILLASTQLKTTQSKGLQVPPFVILFIIASVIAGFMQFDKSIVGYFTLSSKSLFCAALFLIGTQITWESLKSLSGRLVSMAIALWSLLSVSSLFWILSLS